MKETISSKRLGENYLRIQHKSGLTLLLCPMDGYSTAYAMFGTKYGSIDTSFKTSEEKDFITVPEGIAHYLEHKLFESEDGDAFARYAATGASANAFTSFDRTAYLFSCTDQFRESLEILLDFVTHPYFTKETVEKEQGIIGQEISMYDDNPDWRVYFNLLGALYQNNPVRIDIAGTKETIAKINAELLYKCYDTFYNLNNMVLTIAGNFDVDTVLELADKILKPSKNVTVERAPVEEPEGVFQKEVIQNLPVATPLFQLGFKGKSYNSAQNIRNQVLDEILLDIVAGECTPLYRRLYDGGFINQTFMGEVMVSRDYLAVIYSGESKDPKRVYEELCKEIKRIQAEGIDPEMFARCKKATYGRYIGMYGKVEAVSSLMMLTHFAGLDNMYELLDIVADATVEQLTQRLKEDFDTEKGALSIVSAKE